MAAVVPVMVRSRVRVLLLILLASSLFGCDEATKEAARSHLAGGGSVQLVRGALDLRYVQNDDIAFSAFRQLGVAHSAPLLAALAIVGLAAALGLAFATTQWAARVGLAMIVGGALGNLADRIGRGYVVDFIHIHGWPVFNVADIAVVAAIGVLMIARLRAPKPPATPRARADA